MSDNGDIGSKFQEFYQRMDKCVTLKMDFLKIFNISNNIPYVKHTVYILNHVQYVVHIIEFFIE